VTKTCFGEPVETLAQRSMSDFVFGLEATEDISRGEEVTIQYIDDHSVCNILIPLVQIIFICFFYVLMSIYDCNYVIRKVKGKQAPISSIWI